MYDINTKSDKGRIIRKTKDGRVIIRTRRNFWCYKLYKKWRIGEFTHDSLSRGMKKLEQLNKEDLEIFKVYLEYKKESYNCSNALSITAIMVAAISVIVSMYSLIYDDTTMLYEIFPKIKGLNPDVTVNQVFFGVMLMMLIMIIFIGISSMSKSHSYSSFIMLQTAVEKELNKRALEEIEVRSFDGVKKGYQNEYMDIYRATNVLIRLKKLLDNGIITQTEFDIKKKELLGL